MGAGLEGAKVRILGRSYTNVAFWVGSRKLAVIAALPRSGGLFCGFTGHPTPVSVVDRSRGFGERNRPARCTGTSGKPVGTLTSIGEQRKKVPSKDYDKAPLLIHGPGEPGSDGGFAIERNMRFEPLEEVKTQKGARPAALPDRDADPHNTATATEVTAWQVRVGVAVVSAAAGTCVARFHAVLTEVMITMAGRGPVRT